MTDLAEFLLARIVEDEALARNDMPTGARRNGKATAVATARRVRTECEAKRRIVEHHSGRPTFSNWPTSCDGCSEDCLYCEGEHAWPCQTLRLLALPYVDHPDYDEAWRL